MLLFQLYLGPYIVLTWKNDDYTHLPLLAIFSPRILEERGYY